MERLINIEYNLPLGLYHNLNARLQHAYILLLEGISRMEQKVCVPLFNPDELLKVYEAIHYDYPEIKLVWWYKESKYSIRQIDTSRTTEYRIESCANH